MNNKQEIDKLLSAHEALIASEARKYATNIPLITVQIEAHKLAVEAAKSYSPSVGKFSTHLVNSLKKLSRLSTQYGSTVRLPENTQFAINKITKLEKDLEHEFGREATTAELADRSGFNLKTVNNLMSSKKSLASFSSLLNTPTMVSGSNDEWLSFVYHDLPHKDKIILEHKIGFGGKKVMSDDELVIKTGLSPTQLKQRVSIISKLINSGWK
jgi:DNA-directed RNA polymerase sigma subunit (sigma70/sigma32)